MSVISLSHSGMLGELASLHLLIHSFYLPLKRSVSAMTTHLPRPPYTPDELKKLYPEELQLRQVQVILRHGERTPVGPRFQDAGLHPYWPYCLAARQMRSVIMTAKDATNFDSMEWKRRIETFDKQDFPTLAEGPNEEADSICNPGELTDTGRKTTLALGERLRHLYVDQLSFLPSILTDPALLYIRATPIPRALESVQQAFLGLYPPTARIADLPSPTIVTRSPQDETLYPNETACKRFAQLSAAFAQRAAALWNESPEMDYLNKKIGRYMPESSPKVAIDSHPRLSGIMDTVNATLAHGPSTRLPSAFYDSQVREFMDKMVVEEWFSGYQESEEYRALGIGGLVRDMVLRLSQTVDASTAHETHKFCISGAHDTTLAGVVASLGGYAGESWPPFTSHVAMELFRKKTASDDVFPTSGGWRIPFFTFGQSKPSPRTPVAELDASSRARFREWYVRIRYNDRPITVPGCKPEGKHLPGDETFCTLEAFKEITDKFAPRNWKSQCRENLGKSAFPDEPQPAGQ